MQFLSRSLLLLAALSLTALGQNVTYVDAAATGTGDGSSWANAYPALTLACQQTFDGEIWVAAGTYRNNDFGFRQTSILPKEGVEIYGGFDGTEFLREERDPEANLTVLDGDLDGDDIFYLGNINDNSHHIVRVVGLQDCLFDGFTFRGGYTQGSTSQVGAAIRVIAGNVRVRNCRFTENVAKFGASIGTESVCSVTIEDCVFELNEVRYGRGAGVHVGTGATAVIRDCRFLNNRATGGTVIGTGAGVNADLSSTLTVEGCTFDSNEAVFGCCGGITASEGGAIRSRGENCTVRACRFIGNEAHEGGAIALSGSGIVENCLFSGNRASLDLGYGGFGGAILVRGTGNDWTFRGITVSRNVALFGSAGIYADPGAGVVSIEDSVLWENADLRGQVSVAQVENATASHCCIQNFLAAAPGDPLPDPADFNACIDQNPQFRDANGADNIYGTADDDLLLLPTSPCIDAGAPTNATGGFDLEGSLRRLDGDFDTLRRVDMGACEFRPAELSITKSQLPNGDTLLVADIEAADFYPIFLSIGLPRSSAQIIEPYGEWYVDWDQAFIFELVGYGNVAPTLPLPPNFPMLTAAFQAVALTGPGTGTFTRPVNVLVP